MSADTEPDQTRIRTRPSRDGKRLVVESARSCGDEDCDCCECNFELLDREQVRHLRDRLDAWLRGEA